MKISPLKLVIAASFTAQPLERTIRWLSEKIPMSISLEFAPYNQILQQFLDPASHISNNSKGINIILYRIEDWIRDLEMPNAQSRSLIDKIHQYERDFISSVQTFVQRERTECFFLACPPSPDFKAKPDLYDTALSVQNRIADALSKLPGIHILSSDAFEKLYPVKNYYEPTRDILGHAPYTNEMYTALGLFLIRHVNALTRSPFKVIVLDADNTLWKGECGELGPNGIAITPAFQDLQKFMLNQMQQGMLLCLCSKNNPQDVMEVFSSHPQMILQPKHFVYMQINWQPKSENLRHLAEKLQLSLNSFIFIDDNPVECADVKANCPEVMTLQLPSQPDLIPHFLANAWVFDHLNVTEEDKQRTLLYHQEEHRQQFLKTQNTFEDFIKNLELQVDFTPITSENIARAAQLTHRTTQFNANPIQRIESQIEQYCSQSHHQGYVLGVKDRFGDYGLVGVLLTSLDGNAFVADAFLLSCRVLGRGVEHRLMQKLGELAKISHCTEIRIPYTKTARNTPVIEFLTSLHPKKITPKTFCFDPGTANP